MESPRKPPAVSRPPTIPYAGGSAPQPAAELAAPSPPPPPPRELTPAVNRRSWTDPVVRFWLLASLVLLGIGGWFIASQVNAYRNEARLISTGTPVTATIVSVDAGTGMDSRIGRKAPPTSPVVLRFTINGQTTDVEGALSTDDFITVGNKVLLHVDPNDTSVWTDRKEPEWLLRRLIAGSVIIPAVAITLFAALFLRRRLLRIWRDGEAAMFAVVDTRYSALAPLSHTVRCVLANQRDPTINVVYIPARFPRPQRGEVLWLIKPTMKSKTAFAACAFE